MLYLYCVNFLYYLLPNNTVNPLVFLSDHHMLCLSYLEGETNELFWCQGMYSYHHHHH